MNSVPTVAGCWTSNVHRGRIDSPLRHVSVRILWHISWSSSFPSSKFCQYLKLNGRLYSDYARGCTIRSLIPSGARGFLLFFKTGPGDHPASYAIDISVSFPIVKRQGREFDHPSPSLEVSLHAVIAWAGTALPFAFTTNQLTVTSLHILSSLFLIEHPLMLCRLI